MAGIAASSGSVCSSSMKPAYLAMGLSNEEAFGSLRITLGFENSYEELDYFIDELQTIIRTLEIFHHFIKTQYNFMEVLCKSQKKMYCLPFQKSMTLKYQ